MGTRPLEGIRIADFSWVWAAPTASSIMADLGAEVIKIESSKILDNSRGRLGNPGFHTLLNRGKKSCRLNLNTSMGADLAKRLAAISDIVMENFTPGIMKRWGLDYESISQVKPDIIMASLSGYGQTGPYQGYDAIAPSIEAFAGACSLLGYVDGPPCGVGVHYVDVIAGTHFAVAILAALQYREKTGKGQYIDLSMTETTVGSFPEAFMEYLMNGRRQPRMGNRDDVMVPHGCYPCKGDNQWIAIAVDGQAEWEQFCKVSGNEAWLQDERFADELARHDHEDELDELIATWTRQYRPLELTHLLQKGGIAAGPSYNIKEVIEDPHSKERHTFTELEYPNAGKFLTWSTVPRFSRTPGQIRGRAPIMGEHEHYVYGELLGLSEEEIESLIRDGTIQ